MPATHSPAPDSSASEPAAVPLATSQSIPNYLRDILHKRRQGYEIEPSRILEDFRNEQRTTESYNGRQLLELLQNADDAAGGQATGSRRVLLRLTEQELLVANTGSPFTVGGVRSLLFANLSPKPGQLNQIGAKGLGFRALLNWSPYLRIDSGELHLEFSPAIAHAFLDELRTTNELVQQELAGEPERHPIALLRWAEPRPAPTQPRVPGYDTLITLNLAETPGLAARIQPLLHALKPEVLLFLQHLDEVLIETPAGRHTLHCSARGGDAVRVWTEEYAREWQVFTRPTSFEGEKYVIKAAWNPEWARAPNANYLHTFFPTKVAWPFPVLVHAPFELTANRENLINDPLGLNRHLLKELAPLLIQVALALRERAVTQDRFCPLRTVWSRDQPLGHGLENLDFAAELTACLRPAALFPQVGGSYGRLAESRYSELPLARYLPATICPALLVYPTAPADAVALTGLIRLLGPPTQYRATELLAQVATARPQLAAAPYAQLLALLVRQLKSEQWAPAAGGLPPLFTSEEGTALTSGPELPVFLPPDEADSPTARRVPVRLLAVEQAEALRQAFQVGTFTELATELRLLHLRPYSFPELVRALLSHGAHSSPQRLHRELFRFFQAECRRLGGKQPPERPASLDIPLPTLGVAGKRGKSRWGHQLYFGQAYEKPLCETLYHYCKSEKIVAGPSELGLTGKLAEIIAYLRWCGVAEEPRASVQLLEAADRTYVEYALRRFDYRRHSMQDLRPRDFAELQRERYWTGDCQVTTLDDLPNLLRKSQHLSAVLAWVGNSVHLAQATEPAGSWLEVVYGSAINYRNLHGRQLPNFLAWQLLTTHWLPAEGWAKRVSPAQVVLSPTIGPEFRPHLFRLPPKLAPQNWARQEFESYAAYKKALLLIGVRETIESVDVDLIYTVLQRLPEVDPTGQAARSIYHELATNFVWRPEYAASTSYRTFCRTGSVWCTKGGVGSYYAVATAYYLATALPSPALRELFPLLALAGSHGSDKIKELLGVSPLPPLALRLSTEPPPHPLQAHFEEDWHHLLPYLYAFHLDKSSREDSLRWLQELRIHLCTTLPATYQHENLSRTVDIADYHFVFPIIGRRHVWVRVPATVGNLDQLQQEADAGEAIAQVVCQALGTMADKAHYELLFAANRTRRDGILRNKLPSLGPSGLEEARQQLAYTSRAAQVFWTQFVHATGSRRTARLPTRPEDWHSWLLARFPAAATLLSSILADTNWEALDRAEGLALDEMDAIWQLFDAVDLPMAKFHSAGLLKLNFTPLIIRSLEQVRDSYRPHFQAALHQQLASQSRPQQQQYLAKLGRYLNFLPLADATRRDSLAAWWVNVVRREFQLPTDWQEADNNPTARYQINWQQLLAYSETQGIPQTYVRDVFLANEAWRSLVYFDQLPYLQQTLHEHYQPPATGSSGATAATDRVVRMGTSTYQYATLADLRRLLEDLPRPQAPITVVKPLRPVAAAGSSSTLGPRAGRLGSNGAAQAEKRGQTGFLGELFAYWRLCEAHGRDNVVWESGNAQEARYATESNDAVGYDLRYRVAADQQWHRVEVKAGWEDQPLTEFQLTAGELEAGRHWGKFYELLLVSGVSQGPVGASFTLIQAPFAFKGNTSFLDNPYFQVATRMYQLRFRT